MASSLENEVHLPLVDISQFEMELQASPPNELQNHYNVAKVREACKEWGIFRLVNHGITHNLLQTVESASGVLFSLPAETKERAAGSYRESGYAKYSSNENFIFNDLPHSNSVHEVIQNIWPLPEDESATIWYIIQSSLVFHIL